ncbi:MAG: PaaI family thioesterase [Propionibacteriaceae bacterium]
MSEAEPAPEAESADRSRTYTWFDPTPLTRHPESSGLDLLRRMGHDLPGPPISYTLGFELEEISEGRAVFAMDPAEFHENPLGTVHGGVLATLLDSATGCALHSTLPPGMGYTTTSLNVTYTRPVTPRTGRVRCIGEVPPPPPPPPPPPARVVDAADKLLAHATSTLLLFPLTAEP